MQNNKQPERDRCVHRDLDLN